MEVAFIVIGVIALLFIFIISIAMFADGFYPLPMLANIVALVVVIGCLYGVYKLQNQPEVVEVEPPIITDGYHGINFYKPMRVVKTRRYKPWSVSSVTTYRVEEP